jgi:hypothetical protein
VFVMSNLQPVSRTRHAASRWRSADGYGFASRETVVVLSAAEVAQAAVALPLAFVQQGGGYVAVAVLGVRAGENLLVAPDGQWRGAYVPAVLRAHPFALTQAADGQRLLCVDEDSDLVSVNGADASGEPFFAADGEPSPALAERLNFLRQLDASAASAQKACAELQAQNLIQPWNITYRGPEGEQPIAGLFQVDEAALGRLPDEAFARLRPCGALPMAYCQLLSMQNLRLLGRLSEGRSVAPARTAASPQSDLEFLSEGGVLRFGL